MSQCIFSCPFIVSANARATRFVITALVVLLFFDGPRRVRVSLLVFFLDSSSFRSFSFLFLVIMLVILLLHHTRTGGRWLCRARELRGNDAVGSQWRRTDRRPTMSAIKPISDVKLPVGTVTG